MYSPNSKADTTQVQSATNQILELPNEKDISIYVNAAFTMAENFMGVSFRGGDVSYSLAKNAAQTKLLYGDPIGLKISSNNAPVQHILNGNSICWDEWSCGCEQVKIEYKVKERALPDDVLMGIARLAAWMFENRGDVKTEGAIYESGAYDFFSSYQQGTFLS